MATFDRLAEDLAILMVLLPVLIGGLGMVAFLVAGSKALLSKRRRK